MRFITWALACAAVVLSGCATNLSKVQYSTKPAEVGSRYRSIEASQRNCEVTSQIALYADASNQLWLFCPYRYQGIVPLLAHIGPDTQRQPTEFIYAAAQQQVRNMKRLPLRSCGNNRWCAKLDDMGLVDFTVSSNGFLANVSYKDLSGAKADLQAFYAQIDGRPTWAPLDPALRDQLDGNAVAAKIYGLTTVAQVDAVQSQLMAQGLNGSPHIGSALLTHRKALQTAAFRSQGTFAGFQGAYNLTRDAADLDQMRVLATSPAEKSVLFNALIDSMGYAKPADILARVEPYASSPADQERVAQLKRDIEEQRLADIKRREAAQLAERQRQDAQRAAEERRQADARAATEKAAQAKRDEERCLRDAKCRAAYEERQAQCVQKVKTCRAGCDRFTGAGSYSGIAAGLSAALLARGCYAGCTCEANLGGLLGSVSDIASDRGTSSGPATKTTAPVSKTFECKIYCKSGSGPTISRRIEASSRKDAAKLAGDRSNEFCEKAGLGKSSVLTLAESQCVER